MYKYKQNIFIYDLRIEMDFFSFGIKTLKKKISVPILDGRNKLILVYYSLHLWRFTGNSQSLWDDDRPTVVLMKTVMTFQVSTYCN